MNATLRRLETQRGQTMPFWVLASITTLVLTFFLYNYANTVRWQIRAQNAADSAAVALLGQDAAAANSVTTLLYALNIQEVRVRSVENAMQSLIFQGDLSGGGTCSGFSGLITSTSACLGNVATLASAYASDTTAYANLLTQLQSFAGQISDLVGNSTSANNLLGVLFASGTNPTGGAGCIKLNTDCSFKYTATVSVLTAGAPVVADVYACRAVTSLESGFLGISSANSTFYAIGHARVTLAPLSQGAFSPGSAVDPGTGNVFQAAQALIPGISASGAFGTNFLGLTVTSGFLVPQPAPPGTGTAPTRSALC